MSSEQRVADFYINVAPADSAYKLAPVDNQAFITWARQYTDKINHHTPIENSLVRSTKHLIQDIRDYICYHIDHEKYVWKRAVDDLEWLINHISSDGKVHFTDEFTQLKFEQIYDRYHVFPKHYPGEWDEIVVRDDITEYNAKRLGVEYTYPGMEKDDEEIRQTREKYKSNCTDYVKSKPIEFDESMFSPTAQHFPNWEELPQSLKNSVLYLLQQAGIELQLPTIRHIATTFFRDDWLNVSIITSETYYSLNLKREPEVVRREKNLPSSIWTFDAFSYPNAMPYN